MFRFAFVGALALAAGTVALAAPPLPDAVPVEAFAALPSLEDPKLSPDGTKVAAKIGIGGQQYLIVQPLFGGGKPSAMAQDRTDINWWDWVNDDWLVVGIGDDELIYGEEYYIRAIVGASADMKTIRLIDRDRRGIEADDVIWIARDGSPRLLLSKPTGIHTVDEWYPSVWDVDISTGKVKRVVNSKEGVWNWAADASGVVRYGVIWREGKRRGIVYRGAEGESFERVMFGKREEESVPEPIIFKADGNAIAVDDGGGRAAVYEMALPSFTLGKKLFENQRYDVSAIFENAAGTDAAGFGVIARRPEVEWLDPEMKDIQNGLEATLGRGNARIISFSRDRKKLLVEVGQPSQAGAIYYWDTDGAQMDRIAWNSSILKNRTLSPVSTIEYKARDGVLIEGVLTLPRGRPHKALPLIVMPHGGPETRDDEAFDWWAQFLAEQGYAVVQPNYRGSTGYGTAFQDLGKGQWGLKMQDDLIDGIRWLADQGVVDAKRVCIVGASYGGYAAMRAAQRDAAHYRCAVSYAGISDLNVMLKYDRSMFGKGVVDSWKEAAPDFKAVSPRFHASEFGSPILIAHGVADKRVPVKQSRMLVAALQGAGKPYEYLEQKWGDHHFSRAEDRLEFLKALKAFLDKHNPA